MITCYYRSRLKPCDSHAGRPSSPTQNSTNAPSKCVQGFHQPYDRSWFLCTLRLCVVQWPIALRQPLGSTVIGTKTQTEKRCQYKDVASCCTDLCDEINIFENIEISFKCCSSLTDQGQPTAPPLGNQLGLR